ncbi:HET domain containing protein [Colletotrichum tofieldiae]|nr:HET domain containing protein [Colletotrichum tofieldiae]
MWLINTSTLHLEEFFVSDRPKYAILSHTWGKEEVSFQEWLAWQQGDLDARSQIEAKRGFQKIVSACQTARKQLLHHIWVDTNCIDKKSSAELSEAINSMFDWYRESAVCYVHLDDLQPGLLREKLTECRWFTRGWTLQELLAPHTMEFFNDYWECQGSKNSLASIIASITGIDISVLLGQATISSACIARRMFWASGRQTTRPEDMAYCLLGIFNINMPLLYGEGIQAFRRLQEEIMKVSTDQSLFAWEWTQTTIGSFRDGHWVSLLAPDPSNFWACRNVVQVDLDAGGNRQRGLWEREFTMTNLGLTLTLPLMPTASTSTYYGILGCQLESPWEEEHILCVPLDTNQSESTFMRHSSGVLCTISIRRRYVPAQGTTVCFPRFSEIRGHYPQDMTPMPCLVEPGTTSLLFQLLPIGQALRNWHIGENFTSAKQCIQVRASFEEISNTRLHAGFCIHVRNTETGARYLFLSLWMSDQELTHNCLERYISFPLCAEEREGIFSRAITDFIVDRQYSKKASCDGLTIRVGEIRVSKSGYGDVVPLYFFVEDN